MRSLGMQFVLSLMIGGTSVEGVANFLSQMSYSREDETEADMHGREIMLAAKMDPKGIRKFFEGMKTFEDDMFSEIIGEPKEENSEKAWAETIMDWPIWEYLSTHPDTEKRIKRLAEQEKNMDFKPALSQKQWEALKNICDLTKPIKL